jgi:hypothetical protein
LRMSWLIVGIRSPSLLKRARALCQDGLAPLRSFRV